MADRFVTSSEEHPLKNIIHCNQVIREIVQRNVQKFLQLRDDVLSKPEVKSLTIFTDILSPVIEGLRIEQLKACAHTDKIQLAFCGENSSGKTAFLHNFLKIGKILPSGDGAVTARITKMTYASPKRASIRLYHALRDPTIIKEVDISSFFINEKPDWMGISSILAPFTKRPDNINDQSSDFDNWARCMLEISIPSPTLALGIDVYDTPGFLFDDAQVLKEILHDLVELIRPTIVFLYANPSTDDGTRGCFLAMKAALHDIEDTNIFFLNSKADVQRMPKFRKDMSREEFLQMLNEERTERYQMLLKAPFLASANLMSFPSSVEQCLYFDMCSVNSQIIKPYGATINDMAIERIIRFVANDDMRMTTTVCRLILPILDAFFQFFHLTHNRTAEQLLQLKHDGMQWSKKYFELYTQQTERFLTNLFAKISTRLNTREENVLGICKEYRQGQQFIGTFISSAINLDMLRPAIREAIKESMSDILEAIRSASELTGGYIRNEIIVKAIGQQEICDFAAMLLDDRARGISITPSILYMINTFAIPTMTCAKSLETKAEEVVQAILNTNDDQSSVNKKVSASFLKKQATRCISVIKEKLEEQKMIMNRAVAMAGVKQRSILESLVQQTYIEISPQLTLQKEILNQIEVHTPQFIAIECELRAAQDMARFAGQSPVLRSDQKQNKIFSIFTVDWGEEKNLIVKKLTKNIPDQPYVAYYEAHHHLQVAKLQHNNIVNLRYLYKQHVSEESSELWMIFPNVSTNLGQFSGDNAIQIPLEQVLRWMISITEVLKMLHHNERTHGNVTLGNIGLDDYGDVYLLDFDDSNVEIDLMFYQRSSITDQNFHGDIQALGQVGRTLIDMIPTNEQNYLSVFEFRELMDRCILTDENPISADFVLKRLKCLNNNL